MDPFISVIIPLYNKEKIIKQTLWSVLSQTFRNFEIIIVDDGSTDNSLEIVSQIEDDRICIIPKKNEGVSDARNQGIKASTSEYIYFLDADDTMQPHCLASFVKLINSYEEQFVFVSNLRIIGRNGNEYNFCKRNQFERIVEKPIKAFWWREIFPRTGTMIIRRECFDEIGFFDKRIGFHEDTEFVLRLLNKYPVVYTPDVNFSYVMEANGESIKLHLFDKEFSYYADLSGKSFYEKLILAEVILKSYMRRKRVSDTEVMMIIKKRYQKDVLFIIISKILRKVDEYALIAKAKLKFVI